MFLQIFYALQGACVMCQLTCVQVRLARILALVWRLVTLATAVFVQTVTEGPTVSKRNKVSVLHKIQAVPDHIAFTLVMHFHSHSLV